MRKVTITFQDGRTEEFTTVKEAAQALNCNVNTVKKMALGRSITREHLKIKCIKVDTNAGRLRIGGVTGKKHAVKCTNQNGDVIISESISAFWRTINKPWKNISTYVDDGKYHFGWRFESCDYVKPLIFKEPIDNDLIQKLYAYARHTLIKYYDIPEAEKEDAVQEAVEVVASEESRGLYERTSKKLSKNGWLYLRLKKETHDRMRKFFRRRNRIEEPPEDMPRDTWLEEAGSIEDDYDTAAMMEEMPAELKPLAIAYAQGYKATEIGAVVGINSKEKRQLTERLVKWLQERRLGGEYPI